MVEQTVMVLALEYLVKFQCDGEEEWVSHEDLLDNEPWMVNKYLHDHKNDLRDNCKMEWSPTSRIGPQGRTS